VNTKGGLPTRYEQIGEWLQLNPKVSIDDILIQLNKDIATSGIDVEISSDNWPDIVRDLSELISSLSKSPGEQLSNLLYRIDMPEEAVSLLRGGPQELEKGCKLILLRICMKVHYKIMYSA